MRLRLVIVVAVLVVWVLWGSVAVAFDYCAMMGALCEAPCGLGILGLPTVVPSLPRLVPTSVSRWSTGEDSSPELEAGSAARTSMPVVTNPITLTALLPVIVHVVVPSTWVSEVTSS